MNPLTDPDILRGLRGVFALVVPEAILVAAACGLYVAGTFAGVGRRAVAVAALVALVVAAVVAWAGDTPRTPLLTVSALAPDALAGLTRWLALASGAALVLLGWHGVDDRRAADYQASLLVATAGLSLSGAANELVTLFLALEMVSIPTYVLLYLPRADRPAQEATVKYFLLSVVSSGVMLFGFSYLYGLTGATNIPAIHAALANADLDNKQPGVALMAVAMVVAGLGYKITAVPFHFYAPDVYQGTAPAPLAVLAFVPKAAGFAALVRVLGLTGPNATELPFVGQVPVVLWLLAAITMTLGNVLALGQDNLKRMLAYSSIAHGGYMLIGLATVAQELLLARAYDEKVTPPPVGGVTALLFYVVAYGAMTVGTFAVLAYLHRGVKPAETVDDLAGLGKSHPGTAAALAVFLFSLIGLPLTAGFAGKFLLFLGALATPNPPLTPGAQAPVVAQLFPLLALIGAVNAAVAAYYYLRVVAAMYLRSGVKPLDPTRLNPAAVTAWACAAVTLVLGVYPRPVLEWAQKAAPPAGGAAPQTAQR